MSIKIFCNFTGQQSPKINLLINDSEIKCDINWEPDQHNNICMSSDFVITQDSVLSVKVDNLVAGNVFKVVELVIDDIRFGIILFLSSKVSGQLSTQLNNNGSIDVQVEYPIWQYWCTLLNKFNYKDYPLGSAD